MLHLGLDHHYLVELNFYQVDGVCSVCYCSAKSLATAASTITVEVAKIAMN